MAMIDIVYRHSHEPDENIDIRRPTIEIMSDYLKGLVVDMQMSDISSRFKDVPADGENIVCINGKDVRRILEGLEIKMLDCDETCDHDSVNIIRFDRPTLDWHKDIIEDIPDVLMKNAISKVFADINNNRIL